jgi:hypothetical protein
LCELKRAILIGEGKTLTPDPSPVATGEGSETVRLEKTLTPDPSPVAMGEGRRMQ